MALATPDISFDKIRVIVGVEGFFLSTDSLFRKKLLFQLLH